MSNTKPDDQEEYDAPIGGGGILLPDSAELAKREEAERNRRESQNQKFFRRLQRIQTRSQIAQARANIVIAKFTAALAVAAFVGGSVAWMQFQAAKQSADAARDAARIARDALDSNDISSFDTMLQMKAQSRATQKSAEAARSAATTASRAAEDTHELAISAGKQADISRQQLDSSERPWVKIDLDLFVAPSESSPASFDSSGMLHLNVLIVAKNVGKSPAVKAQVSAELTPSTLPSNDPSERQRKMCEAIHSLSLSRDFNLGSGDTVFPGDPYRRQQYLRLSSAAIKSELAAPSNKTYVTPQGSFITFATADSGFGGVGVETAKLLGAIPAPSVSIIGCLDYSIDYSNVRHQTMFLYDVQGINLRQSKIGAVALSKTFGYGNSAN